MTSLTQIIQRLKFKPVFELLHNPSYQKNYIDIANISNRTFERFILYSMFFGLPWVMLVGYLLPESYKASGLVAAILVIAPMALSLIPSLLTLRRHKDKIAYFRKNKKNLASYKNDFHSQLKSLTYKRDDLIALFEAFEAEPEIKNQFKLAQLFHDVNLHTQSKDKMATPHISNLLTPIFTHFLTVQYKKLGINLDNDYDIIEKNYLETLEQARQQSDARDLLFSTNPPLKVNSLNARM